MRSILENCGTKIGYSLDEFLYDTGNQRMGFNIPGISGGGGRGTYGVAGTVCYRVPVGKAGANLNMCASGHASSSGGSKSAGLTGAGLTLSIPIGGPKK